LAMDWVKQLRGILSRYARQREAPGAQHVTDISRADHDFADVARAVPKSTLASALAEALRSGETRPFPELAVHLFSESTRDAKVALLNLLLGRRPAAATDELGRLAGPNREGALEEIDRVDAGTVERLAAELDPAGLGPAPR
jgi:hypothetical protein